MKQLFNALFFAPDAENQNAGGENKPVDAITDIMDNFALPTAIRGRSGGSKYRPEDLVKKVENMKVGQGVIVPFMGGKEKDPKDPSKPTHQRQRYATKWQLDQYAKTLEVAEVKEGDKVVKAAIPAPKFSVGIIEGKGIGIRRDA